MINHLGQLNIAISSIGKIISTAFVLGSLDKKYLKEYRCPTCNKLLAKGSMSSHDDLLEVKCRGCSTICLFRGEHAEIVKERSRLIKEGIIPGDDV